MKTPRILITGASGFIGTHLCLRFSKSEAFVMGLRSRTSPPPSVSAVVEVQTADLTVQEQLSSIMRVASPDVVIHAAALARGEQCERDPDRAFAVNVTATRELIESCERIRAERPILFVFLSTDLVFDGNTISGVASFTENDAPNPVSVYAQTKRQGELEALGSQLEVAVLRLSLCYGNSIGNAESFTAWMERAIRDTDHAEGAPLFTDEWRTPIFVEDVAAVIETIVIRWWQSGFKGTDHRRDIPRLLNLPGPERLSRYDFGIQFAREFQLPPGRVIAVSRTDSPSNFVRARDVSLSSSVLRKTFPELRISTVADGLYRMRTSLAG